jgi:hypothetical protein
MSNVKIQGNASGTGTLTIAAPNTNTDRTLTLPDAAGEIVTASGGVLPALDGSNLTGVSGYTSAYASFGSIHDDATNVAIQAATPVTVPIYRNFVTPKNITVDTSNNRWTHAVTGVYYLHIGFRQETNTDVWNIFGVTKNGTSENVGQSARMGSTNSERKSVSFMYYVDSTTATYQLMGWAAATITVPGIFAAETPGWTEGTGGVYGGGASDGRNYTIDILRAGEL